MIEKESEWILPENLRRQQERERKAVENGTFDGGGDFGSYYAYLKGINYDFIKPHAVSDDQRALGYAKHIRFLLGKFNLKLEGSIIDIGCAIGTITNGVTQLNKNGRTYGLDISEDAIEVARKKYPQCTFFCRSADTLDDFDDDYFDVIHAREFYPFTRTNDADHHLKYLRLFHSKLKRHGFVVLQMVALDEGLCNTYKNISSDLNEIGYSSIRRVTMVPTGFYRLLGKLAYNEIFYPGLLATTKTVFSIIGRGKVGYLYILTKG